MTLRHRGAVGQLGAATMEAPKLDPPPRRLCPSVSEFCHSGAGCSLPAKRASASPHLSVAPMSVAVSHIVAHDDSASKE
jgi:hypothetical protein